MKNKQVDQILETINHIAGTHYTSLNNIPERILMMVLIAMMLEKYAREETR